ncbi:MAG: ABC transporter permease family protein [Ruminiclostridium sp.]
MLHIYLVEITRILKKNRKVFIPTLISFTCSILMIGMALSGYMGQVENEKLLKDGYGNRSFYKIVYDGEIGDLFKKVFRDESILDVQKAMFELSNSKDFDYYYSNPQNIDFFDNTNLKYKDEFLYGYEEGRIHTGYTSLKALYADKKFFEHNTVKLLSGRAFNNREYVVEDKEDIVLPVVLGYDYSDLYQIGDTLYNSTLWDKTPIDLYVVGFLEKNSYFYNNNNKLVALNRYMIIPYIDPTFNPVLKDGSIDSFFVGAYDGIKLMNARIVCENENAETVKNKVISILRENKLYDFFLFEETAGATWVYEMIKQFTLLSLSITIITVMVCTIMMILGIYNKLRREIKNYGIYLLIGFERDQIFVFSVLETILIYIISNLIAFAIFDYMVITKYNDDILQLPIIISILFIEMFLLVFAWLLTMKKVMKENLSSTINAVE